MPLCRWILVATCLCTLPGVSAGACGGGGGSGYGTTTFTPPPDPTYTPTSDAFPGMSTDPGSTATTQALERSVLVVLERQHQPIGIWDDGLVALSKTKTIAFVRETDGEAAAFAARWQIPRLPAVALCDGAGNVLGVTGSPLTAQGVRALLAQADPARSALRTGLSSLLAQAREADRQGHAAAALADVAQVLQFRGLAVCTQAQALQADLIARGHAAVAAAAALEDSSQARAALRALAARYRDSIVADEARAALHQRSSP